MSDDSIPAIASGPPGGTSDDLSFFDRLTKRVQDILIDAVSLVGFLSTLFLGQTLVDHYFPNGKFFDLFPKRWAFDAADLGLIIAFFRRTATRF